MYTCLWTLQQVLYAEHKIYKYAYYMVQLPVLYMVRMHGNTCTTHGTHMPIPRMEYACTMYGICLYHVWNMPVPCMEYASTMHGIHLYQAWNTPVPRMEYGLKRA